MTWFIFFLAVTIADGHLDYELGVIQDRPFESGQDCEAWLADDEKYDSELNMALIALKAASTAEYSDVTLDCAAENELPDYLIPGKGIIK